MSLNLEDINSGWTLFLDRDGVINVEKKDDYIRTWTEFQFYDETLEALGILAYKFSNIVITTNQKGIGKGLMTHEDLANIHKNMLAAIQQKGGRIDHIFYCPDLDNNSPNRKPQPGMAFQAKEMFPTIQFDQSIMVGNRMSDMQFGRNAGLHTVFLATTHPETAFPDVHIDLRFDNLLAFAKSIA
jgi:D-glycero-D-manno-heptose 1,7-bisphosphate phosphatase